MKLPDFFIIGAPRAGTTSLYKYLNKHPDIFLSKIKEPHYFAFDEPPHFKGPGDKKALDSYYVSSIEEYKDLFKNTDSYDAVGEASAQYLYSKVAAKKIKSLIPDARIIILLRNPLERAYSHYLRMLSHGREKIQNFEKSLEKESERIKNNWSWAWHYRNVSLYYLQVKRYLDIFPKDQVKIIFFEDFKNETEGELNDLYDFLKVPRFRIKEVKQHNKSGVFSSPFLRNIASIDSVRSVLSFLPRRYKNTIKNNFYSKPKLNEETKNYLIAKYFREDILKLQNLLDKDFSHWLPND